MPPRQFAHVFLNSVTGRDIVRLAVPREHSHRPTFIQTAGQTFYPNERIILRPGTSLLVLISGAEIDTLNGQAADVSSFFQRNATLITPQPRHCKQGDNVQADEFPITFLDQNIRQPPRPYHDGSEQWIADMAPMFETAVVIDFYGGATLTGPTLGK